MKVENIKTNYVGAGKGLPKKQATPNFTSVASIAKQPETALDILEKIAPQRPLRNFVKFFEKWKGEKGGVIISAIGTGFVAPFSIAFNPFVKAGPNATEEEKKEISNKKKYTAWRQPISAVIAFVFQTQLLSPIDRAFESFTNNSEYAVKFPVALNQSALQSKAYLERVIDKEMRQNPSDDTIKQLDKKEYKELLNKKVKARQQAQVSEVAEELVKSGQIRIADQVVCNKDIVESFNKVVYNYSNNMDKFLKAPDVVKYYIDFADSLIANENDFRTLLSPKIITQYTGKPKELRAYIDSIKTEVPGMKYALQHLSEKPDALIESHCKRILERIDRVKALFPNGYSRDEYLKFFEDRQNYLDDIKANIEKCVIEDVDKANPSVIREKIVKLAQACTFDSKSVNMLNCFDGTNTLQTNVQDSIKKVSKEIVESYKVTLGHRCGGFAQIVKILINVGIALPATCTALNWVYPRFMNIFFPHLAGKKASSEEVKNGGDK